MLKGGVMHSTLKLQSGSIIVTSCSFPENFNLSNAQPYWSTNVEDKVLLQILLHA